MKEINENGVFLDTEKMVLIAKRSSIKESLFKDGISLLYGEHKGKWGFFIGLLSVGTSGQGGPLVESDLVYSSWQEMVPYLKAFLVKIIVERFDSSDKMLKSLNEQIDELNKKYSDTKTFIQGELF